MARIDKRIQGGSSKSCIGAEDRLLYDGVLLEARSRLREPVDHAAALQFFEYLGGKKIPRIGDASCDDNEWRIHGVNERRDADADRAAGFLEDRTRILIA